MIMGSELLNDASDHDLSAAIPSSGLTLRSTTTMKNCTLYLICLWLITLASLISGYPSSSLSLPSRTFQTRTTPPTFPDYPPSCPICAQGYPSIDSCAQAAPVLANFSMIIFNPGAFIDVIKCACTDTFQSAFPQCVDCFTQTNQTDVLDTPDLPSIVDGMRKVCSLASSLIGGVASADGEIPSSTSPTVPSATSGAIIHRFTSDQFTNMILGSIALVLLL